VSRKRVAVLVLGLLPLALVLGLEWMRRRTTAQEPASLLLVTLDTLRADRVGAWGGPPGLTPVLDALAARGLVFEEALASVPLTLPSHATLFTGLEPPRHGVHDNGTYVLPADVETLATRLKAAGYETGAFVGAYVLDRRFGLVRGFDHYDDRIARNERGPGVLESERRGGDVVDAAAAWLRGRTGRVFAWVHLYDAHAPYDPPPPHREAHAGRPYDGEVAYVDACVGRLIDAMRAAPPDRGEPLVAVVADHGESLGEHGELTHGFFVYQSTLRIPFLLAGPGVPAERRKGPARTADLLPTLLGRLGLVIPVGLDGSDLLAGAQPREAYAETHYPVTFGWSPLRSFRIGGFKLIDAPRPELFNLQVDPREEQDLATQRPEEVERLRLAIRALRERGRPPSAATLDSAAEERLRALGYVASAAPVEDADAAGRPDPKDRLGSYRAYEEAVWAESRGDHDAAVAGLERLVKQEPQNSLFRRSLASALRRKGRVLEAVDALGLPGRGREDAVAWHERSIALAQAGRAKEAEESEREALSLNPLLPEPHNHMGVLLARQGRTAAALAHFETAASLDPNNAKAWNNRANALRDLGRRDEAREAYTRASTLAPRDPDPLNGLGTLAVASGKPDEAATLFRRALDLAPEMGDARLNLAVALAQLGRRTDALTEIDRLLRTTNDRELAARASRLRRDLGDNPTS
jgi:arylsulfatase A-like enzyme/Tfp pilus assembly protein PilF